MREERVRKITTAVMVASLATITVTAAVVALPFLRSRFGVSVPVTPEYVAGQQIDVPAALYDSTKYTLIYFASATCGACQRSKASLSQMTSEVSRRAGTRVMLVTSQAFREQELGFGRELGLDDPGIVALNLATLRLKRVPTVVLVDHTGRVLASHVGVLEDGDRQSILDTLDAELGVN